MKAQRYQLATGVTYLRLFVVLSAGVEKLARRCKQQC
jgi:hypothetical protein